MILGTLVLFPSLLRLPRLASRPVGRWRSTPPNVLPQPAIAPRSSLRCGGPMRLGLAARLGQELRAKPEVACLAGLQHLKTLGRHAVPLARGGQLDHGIVDSFIGELEAAEVRADGYPRLEIDVRRHRFFRIDVLRGEDAARVV